MDREHVLAIDLGTGGPKAALVDRSGRIVAHEFEPTPLELLGGGGAEQDPDPDEQSARRLRAFGGCWTTGGVVPGP